jgi:glycosyltransferase involved in cell wall biosynthesis
MQCKIGICLKNQPVEMLVSHERKFFEYLAISLPSVFCNSSIYTDITNNYLVGIPVELNNSNQIAQAIEKLFTNSNFYNNCIIGCQNATNQQYNWEYEALKLKKLYIQLSTN